MSESSSIQVDVSPLVSLQTFGPFKATTREGVDITPRSKKARALLSFLALSPPEGVARSRLAALLWDRVEPEQARNLLRGALHEIRAAMPLAEEIVHATREHLSLRWDRVHVDAEDVLGSRERAMSAIEQSRTDRLLLADLENVSRAFDAWLTSQRHRFAERLMVAASHQIEAEGALPAPLSRSARSAPDETEASAVLLQGRTGIRIGVAPLRTFGGAENDSMSMVLAYEISTALSRFRWLSIPSPDAVTTALGPDRDTTAACSSLGLDFLLDGQIQLLAGKIRLRASLVSAQEAAIIWTFKTDHDSADLLSLQDEIAAEVAARIDSLILTTESHRIGTSETNSHGAYGLVMRAIQIACRLNYDTFATAGELLAKARELEPNNPMAQVSTALFHLIAASQGWLADPSEAMRQAESLARAALMLDPSDAQGWAIIGFIRSALHQQPEEANFLLQRAIELNPNLPLAWHFSTGNFLLLGELGQARACIERYVKLGPTGVHFFGNSALITLNLLEGQFDEAVRVGRTTLGLHENFVAAYKPFVAALGHLGQHDEALLALARLKRLEPDFDVETFLNGRPFRRPQDRACYAEGLRLAGA